MSTNTAREAREAELAARAENLAAAIADVAEAEANLTRSSDVFDARQTRFAETAFLGAKNRATVAAALHAAAKKSLARQIEFEASDDYRETAMHLEDAEAIANGFNCDDVRARLLAIRRQIDHEQTVLDAKTAVQRAAVARVESARAALGHRPFACEGNCYAATSMYAEACRHCGRRVAMSAMAEVTAMKPEAT
jgi:hypothetical protein